MESKIKEFVNGFLLALQNVKRNELKRCSFEIKCDTLKDYLNNNILDEISEHKSLFNFLQSQKGPTLYWIEKNSETSNEKIHKALKSYNGERSTTAVKNEINVDTTCLYVGKVKDGFWARVMTHLGYHKSTNLQGLQLYHWAKGLGLTIRVHYIVFDENMADLLPALEASLAREMKPLFGTRHG